MAMLGENRKQHYLAMLQHILLLIAPDTHSQVNYNRVSAKRPRLIDTNSINTICRKKKSTFGLQSAGAADNGTPQIIMQAGMPGKACCCPFRLEA
jgi:hypothetical protein